MAAIERFEVAVSAADLEDLRSRLAATRWPREEPVEDWSQGVPLRYLRELCAHWGGAYDAERLQRRLNAWPQFRTELDGVAIHFLHVRSPHAAALPLLLTHGWPGSVLEFLASVGPLTEPTRHGGGEEDAFHLVIPSLPGYGFSDAPDEPGWNPDRVARAWARLMARLGYERYGAQGGDWGSAVTRALARLDSPQLLGIHLNSDHVLRETITRLGAESEFERRALAVREAFNREGRGYSRLQGTKPQTIGTALADSPAGQCAWIVEKFAAWSDSGGDPERAFDRDELLDNVTLYWLTNSGASSARMYWETARAPGAAGPAGVPSALTAFPHDINPVPERWIRAQDPDLVHYELAPRGGHFAALEVPELFVAGVRAGFRAIRAARGGAGAPPS